MKKSTRGHLLIVDDQENWRQALGRVLADYQITFARGFGEAKRALDQNRFHLAIVDVRLVDQDVFNVEGLELMKIMRRGKMQMGVIILTGYPEDIRDEILRRYQPDELLLKAPVGSVFDCAALRQKVADLLEQYGVDDGG